MKLVTLNVNGVRSALNKGLVDFIKGSELDILCLQEIKLFETELVEHIFTDLGFHCYWFPAQKKGYSGVAIISKQPAIDVVYGINHKLFDFEGRTILAHFKDLSVLCAYFPSGTTGGVRQTVKFDFLETIQHYIDGLKTPSGNLVLCGDVNICHQEIDIHNPKANAKTSGFLPEERAWVGSFLDSGFIDCFRHKVTDPHHYTWWSLRMGARARNLGWRIDYIFVNKSASDKILNAQIHPSVILSDHCPVSVDLNLNL